MCQAMSLDGEAVWIAAGYKELGPGRYAGVVRHSDTRQVIWRCEHEHSNFGDAVHCARARVENLRRQD